jgi:predicted nucleotidyltransferase
MDSPERDLAEARRIVLERLKGYSAEVFLFGSRARGDARRYSDIDIAIDPKRPLPPGLLAALREDLEESHIIYHVDVVDLSQADEALREQIRREGVPWNG